MLQKLARIFNAPASGDRRWYGLLALGGLSLLVYWTRLILPYNLFVIQPNLLPNIAKLTLHKPLAEASFVLVMALESGFYLFAWLLCRPAGPGQTRRMQISLAILLGALAISMFWLYPIGDGDVFDYMMRARITAVYGANPFAVTPRIFSFDPFFHYTGWPDYTSTYGPLWELLAALISRLAGNGFLANLLGFKLLSLVFYAGSTVLVALILKHVSPDRVLQGVVLFAWNPLTIYDGLGNAHNDLVMIFFLLLGIYVVLRGHFSWGMLALMAGALVKIIPLVVLPLAWIAGLRELRSRQARLRFTLVTGLACASLALAALAPFLNNWGRLKLLPTLSDLYTTSLPAFIQAQLLLHLHLTQKSSQTIVADMAYAALGVFILFQMVRIWKDTRPGGQPVVNRIPASAPAFIRAATWTLLFYLIFTCDWFQPWYSLWPLALAAVLPEGTLTWTAMLLAYVSLWKTPIFNFLLFPARLPPAKVRETLLGPLTLGLVWLYLAARLIYVRRFRTAPRSRPTENLPDP
ncbi:MAG TPA: hypothetical protein VMT91_00315 [Anaerolineales bacterium]|nr:hypothetical protein [Anaerolineales bacterium]